MTVANPARLPDLSGQRNDGMLRGNLPWEAARATRGGPRSGMLRGGGDDRRPAIPVAGILLARSGVLALVVFQPDVGEETDTRNDEEHDEHDDPDHVDSLGGRIRRVHLSHGGKQGTRHQEYCNGRQESGHMAPKR